VDAGIHKPGGLEAGRRIAEICLGGLGHVSLHPVSPFARWPWQVAVHTAQPVLACLGSQYAGWNLACGEGKGAFHALGSGPARALAGNEDLYGELGYRDQADTACLVLEVDKPPPMELVDKVMRDCNVAANRLTFILTPTKSLAGTVQIVARVLEVALHKAHTLQFPLERIIDGMGSAPLPPPAPDFLTAMGRANDAILFGGRAQLFVSGNDDDAQSLASQLSCANSRDYGRPFAEVFKAYKFDFYQIDPHLFAPAEVMVTALESGRTFRGGRVNEQLLEKSFGH
jgi:methenyltetrahydromethanopterin cyclohydrolase